MARSHIRRAGFTLIEAMITVAIIGVLASIAIPAFLNYQNKSRRGEAFANLAAITELEKSYFSEFNAYSSVPVSQPGGGLGPNKRTWTAAAETAFGVVGFNPEGALYYDYEVNVAPGVCPALDCFTATAYGDANGDGLVAMIQYAQPSPAGAFTPSLLFPALGVPADPLTAALLLNVVAVNYNADLY